MYGIIIHEGGINYGHYKSFVRLNSYKWFVFNDDKIIECYGDIQDISNVYSSFYIKLDWFIFIIKNIIYLSIKIIKYCLIY